MRGPIINCRQKQVSDLIYEIGNNDFKNFDFSKSIPAISKACARAVTLIKAEAADLKHGKAPNGPSMLGSYDLNALTGVLGNLLTELELEMLGRGHTPQQLKEARQLLKSLQNGINLGDATNTYILPKR